MLRNIQLISFRVGCLSVFKPWPTTSQLCDLKCYLLSLSYSFLICEVGVSTGPSVLSQCCLEHAVCDELSGPRSAGSPCSLGDCSPALAHCTRPTSCCFMLCPCCLRWNFFSSQAWLLLWISAEFPGHCFPLEIWKDFPVVFWKKKKKNFF